MEPLPTAVERYRSEDLIRFGAAVLEKVGFPARQAQAAALVLVEADLRGDFAHGLAGANSLDKFISQINDDRARLGFKRMEIAEYSRDPDKYPTVITADARGTLGHYVALELIPELAARAREYGCAKAYIRNSTHFGDCGVYSELIARSDLAARVTSTSPPWMRPFIELQDREDQAAEVNRTRYQGVSKRFGTNPLAWSIPYEGGLITIDMAATQRALSPALEVARRNSRALNLEADRNGAFFIGLGGRRVGLAEIHLSVARSDDPAGVLRGLGFDRPVRLFPVEAGLLKGPEGEDISYPLAFDDVFKRHFCIAPLGGTCFGYKGFGLNMLVELDNVIGGGATGLIRVLDDQGNPTTPERVSQTLEAYAIDALFPLAEAKKRLRESVATTLACGNGLMFLPGQKEQETRARFLKEGVPMTPERIGWLRRMAADPRVGLAFDLRPLEGSRTESPA